MRKNADVPERVKRRRYGGFEKLLLLEIVAAELLLEFFDASGGIYELLFARVERVAV